MKRVSSGEAAGNSKIPSQYFDMPCSDKQYYDSPSLKGWIFTKQKDGVVKK